MGMATKVYYYKRIINIIQLVTLLYSNCAEGPSIITDFSGTPTTYGAGYKKHLDQLSNGNVDPYSLTFPIYKGKIQLNHLITVILTRFNR